MRKKKKITNAAELREATRRAARRREELPVDEALSLPVDERLDDVPDEEADEPVVRWDQLFDED